MITVRCEKCGVQVPLRDDRPPPWCPRCGANFKAAVDSIDVTVPADASGLGAQTRIVLSDMIATPVATLNPVDHADAQNIAGLPTAPMTAAVQCYRRYHCLPCGCVYQIRFTEHAESSQTALALGKATEHLMRRLLTTVDPPCPTCGLVRPDYAVRWQFSGHAAILFFAVVVACGIGVLLFSDSPWIKPAALIASSAAGVAMLVHLWVALTNPNRDCEAKRERVQAAVAAGDIEVLEPGSTVDFRDPARPTVSYWLAFLALVLAPLPFLAPVYLHWTRDWPENPGLAPYVIGPGDEIRVLIPNSGLRGLGDYWRATATAQLINAAEVGGPAEFRANSRSEHWGKRIHIRKPSGKLKPNEDRNVPIDDLYANVHIPDVPALGGKTLRVKVTMEVTYPVDRGNQFNLDNYWHEAFQDRTSTVSKEVTVHLTPAGDNRLYRAAWVYGAAIGGFFYFAGGIGLFLLTRGRRPGGYPPELLPASEPVGTHS